MKHINLSHWNRKLFFIALFVLSGCRGLTTENKIRHVISRRIIIPEQICNTYMGEKSYSAILWISKTECTKCRINTLPAYMDFYESTRDYLSFFVIISSPGSLDYSQSVEDLCLPFSVFFDERNRFRFYNWHVPNESEYHFFLLDSSNNPVIVGDPVVNPEIYNLYETVLGIAE